MLVLDESVGFCGIPAAPFKLVLDCCVAPAKMLFSRFFHYVPMPGVLAVVKVYVDLRFVPSRSLCTPVVPVHSFGFGRRLLSEQVQCFACFNPDISP